MLAACQAEATSDPNSTPAPNPLSATLASNHVVITDIPGLVDKDWFGAISYVSLRFEDGRYSLADSSTGWTRVDPPVLTNRSST